MTLDQQLEFLRIEARNLKHRPEPWAAEKVKKFEAVEETVRKVRQDKSMTSAMTSKRIDA